MTFELLLPTGSPSQHFGNLLRCVSKQTLMPYKVTVLRHQRVTQSEHDTFLVKLKLSLKYIPDIDLISNISYPDYEPGRGVGYDRNVLLQHATQDLCYMIDQDNEFDHNHFEKMVTSYRHLQKHVNKEYILLSPTVERRRSGKIQSRGIQKMYYLFPKYLFDKSTNTDGISKVQMIGANSLFGPTKVMQLIGFDPQMQWCYEDIDFSYRWYKQFGYIYVAHDIVIYHMEKDQTPLSRRFLHRSEVAYARAYNRTRFVKKTASSLNKRAYLSFGIWIQTVFFVIFCIIYGGTQRWNLVQAVCQGTWNGVFGCSIE